MIYMGNSQTTVENKNIEEIKKIDETNLDLSNIDKLQIKAIKEIATKIETLENKKSDRIMYKLPAIQLCSWSLI